jgi:hypothetical protein
LGEPILRERRSKVIVVTLVLLATFFGGGLYVDLQSRQPAPLGVDTTSNKLQPIIDAHPWMGVGLSQLNLTTDAVPIVVVSTYSSKSDGSLSIQAGDGLNAMTDIVQDEVNAYCQKIGSKYRFDFVPFPILGTVEGVNASIQVFNDLGVKMVVQDYWTVMWKDDLKTIRDNGMLYIIGRDTSVITDTLNGVYGVRPEILTKGDYYYAITTAKGVKALVVLQRDFSQLPAVQRQSMQQHTDQSMNDYEALGGVVVKKIIYPPPEMVNFYSDIENNTDFTHYLNEAEAAVKEATVIYGKGKIGVLVIGAEMSPLIYQSREMPNLMSVPWFGSDLNSGIGVISGSPASEQVGPYAEKVGFYMPVESVENKVALEKLSGELAAKMGMQSYPFSPQETSRYDGCWLLALSVIKADSTDPRKVEAALPQVAAGYNGLNGNYALNEKGDKISYSVDIYKVYETEPGKYAHLKCGSYNSLTGVIFEDTKQPLP